MRNYQRGIAVTVIVCLVSASCGDWVTTLRAATLPNPVLAKQQVDLFGVGAAVKVKLASGKKLEGTIGAIEGPSFDLISRREGSPRRITYDEVAELKLAKSTYKTRGAPNPDEARRVAAGLGVGKHVAVKVASGKTFRGNIQAINQDHFVLLPDRETASIEIAYGEVQQFGPNPSEGVIVAIIVGVVVVAVAIVWLFAVREAAEQLGPL